jgi:hypothetical protein
MDNRLIAPRMMAARLTMQVNPSVDDVAQWHRVGLAANYCGEYDITTDTCSVTFSLGEREVTIHYPAADLTLPMDEFAARHLTAAAKALMA